MLEDTFTFFKIQQTAVEREIHCVWSDGTPTPGLEEMTNVNSVLSNLKSSIRRAANPSLVTFRDSECVRFIAGGIHNLLG